MLFESSFLSLTSLSHQEHKYELSSSSSDSEEDEQMLPSPSSTKPRQPTLAARRRRAVSTSTSTSIATPLQSLSLCKESSTTPYSSIFSNIDSILNYLPSSPRQHKRSSWNPSASSSLKWTTSKSSAQGAFNGSTSSCRATSEAKTRTTIHSLPTELLCLIFVSYLSPSSSSETKQDEDSPFGAFSISSEYKSTPVPLTHVCARWRRVAIGCKGLWSAISLALVSPSNNGHSGWEKWARGKVEMVRMFLERAGDGGLDVAFSTSASRCPSGLSSAYDEVVKDVIEALCGVKRRWRGLNVQLGRTRDVEMFLEGLVSSTPSFENLQRLQLDLVTEDDEEDDDDDYELFASSAEIDLATERQEEKDMLLVQASLRIKDIYTLFLSRSSSPRLNEIVLDDAFFVCYEGADYAMCPEYVPHGRSGDGGPWAQFKKLTITSNSISARKVVDILAKASAVEEVKLWRIGSASESEIDFSTFSSSSCPPALSSSPVALPNLRALDVTFLTAPEELFGSVSLPNVRRVDVDVQSLSCEWGQEPTGSLREIVGCLELLVRDTRTVDMRCQVNRCCVAKEEKSDVGIEVQIYGRTRGRI